MSLDLLMYVTLGFAPTLAALEVSWIMGKKIRKGEQQQQQFVLSTIKNLQLQ